MSPLRKLIFKNSAVLTKCRLHFYVCPMRTFLSRRVNSSENKTMFDIRQQLLQKLQMDLSFTKEAKPNTEVLKYLPKSQSELPIRKMKDSFDSAIIPLASNPELRNSYSMFLGNVRIGKLMEDVDLFAGYTSFRHLYAPKIPPELSPSHLMVTVSVNRIDFKGIFKSNHDIRVSGHVCWVGTSSLEVLIWLDQEENGNWEEMMRAFLLMAARNPLNTGPAIVNAIEPETDEERALFRGGEERKQKRFKLMRESLLKTVPSEKELHLIHELFIQTMDSKEIFLEKKLLPPNSKWMHDATLKNLVFCHPENRNLHNKIFGGFLIRQALELSWSTAYIYGMRIPRLIHISDIGFYNPVELGSLLKLFASVTYTEENYIQIFVNAEAFSFSENEEKTTTAFNFTYKTETATPYDSLFPSTYLEAMMYIDGRRRFQEFKKTSGSSLKF